MLIGISGKMYSGKDTTATRIIEEFSQYNWKRKSFAYELKKEVAEMTGTTLEENLSEEGKQIIPPGFGVSLGTLQQWVGVNRRARDPDYWVKKVFDQIDPKKDYVVITDVRFPNEYDKNQKKRGRKAYEEELFSFLELSKK